MATSGVDRKARSGLPPPQYPIESVDNALKVLLLFEYRTQIRITDAADYLGVASSTAHRLMAMLQYRGFVRQNPKTREYHPGPALSSIAFAIMGRMDIRATIRPFIERLNREYAETVHLGRLDGAYVTFIESLEGNRAVRVGSRVGRALPAHTTSTGKVMLAELTVTRLRELYPSEELEAVTVNSIGRRTDLEKTLETVREKGFAVSNEESEDGVCSVAVPVCWIDDTTYAINLSVPSHRMTEKLQAEIIKSLKEISEELTRINAT